MLVRDFDFDLPGELIAQDPPQDRSAARLLVLPRTSAPIVHARMTSLPTFLHDGDLLVVNNTKVFPARLLGRRAPSGGAVECLLVMRLDTGPDASDSTSERWEALVHPGQKLQPGSQVVFDGAATLKAEILERRFFGRRTVRLWTEDGTAVQNAIEQIGHVPLPPYIKRQDRASDRERYQTVFARTPGSIAAPTAGLHFNARLLATLSDRGVEVVEITLHVGYGTFQPVRVERVEDHRIEPERYEISLVTATAVNNAIEQRRRVIAVGTTTTRTLEAVGLQHDGRIAAGSGTTGLFIHPGFTFRIINGLLTNFHLPQSSLLMLVAAFAGREQVLAAYREAVTERYRFYSYGDAMLII